MIERMERLMADNGIKRWLMVPLAIVAVLFLSDARSAWAGAPSHMDRSKNPQGCGGCHRGRGVPGTPLLKNTTERICFECHGVMSRGRAKKDLESVFTKRSIHPIYETTKYHVRGEDLPERVPLTPRHVACADCHSSHVATPEMPWKGVRGYSRARMRLKQTSDEYELCYLCHSDSANLPSNQKNKREEFDPYNESYHPVELPGRNRFVPSLVGGLNTNSKLRCTDCHGSNDAFGPRGPHGSDYPPLLVAQYTTTDGVESPRAYELCYMCHDRRSILGNDSFWKHNLHIVTKGTSCYACHASHGSRDTKNLIVFNPNVVSPSNTGLGPQYIYNPTQPRCYLSCHSADHQTLGVYRPDGTKTPGSW